MNNYESLILATLMGYPGTFLSVCDRIRAQYPLAETDEILDDWNDLKKKGLIIQRDQGLFLCSDSGREVITHYLNALQVLYCPGINQKIVLCPT